MDKKGIIYSMIGIIAILLPGCYYDRQNEIHPNISDPCDTSLAATFDKSIILILRTNCVSCHSGSSPSAGIVLDNYKDVSTLVSNGKLMGTIEHKTNYKAMPPGTTIRTCETDKLKIWINGGLPEK